MGKVNFDRVKQQVTPEMVTQRYHEAPNRVGFIRCPFHNDKHASMRVGGKNKKTMFKCMGECAWHGDIFDFVQKFFNISKLETLEKINKDFSLNLDLAPPTKQQMQERADKQQQERHYKQWRVKYLYETVPEYKTIIAGIRETTKQLYRNPESNELESNEPDFYVTYWMVKQTGETKFAKTKKPIAIQEGDEIYPLVENFAFFKPNFKIANPLKASKEQLELMELHAHQMHRLRVIRAQLPTEDELKQIYNKLLTAKP